MKSAKRKSFWGWGWEDFALNDDQAGNIAAAAYARMQKRSGGEKPAILPIPRLEDIRLRPPRISPPENLAHLFTADLYQRASHTYGKSFRDVLRALVGNFEHAPDYVAIPRKDAYEKDLFAILEWCSQARVAAIPYGGGSSVVGGVEPLVSEDYAGTVSIDLRLLSGVDEIDHKSRAACIRAGSLGPDIEDRLRPHGLTLRHFPQSFEFSTLGGWIATRSGGHYATLYTHIDEFVEALEVLTPRGLVVTRRLPGSGAGPSPDRMFIGSEGTLGIVTKAWMRLQRRPTFRAAADVRFNDFGQGVEAVRVISQSGLYPSNCRLLDPLEALLGGGDGKVSILVLAFESADHPVEGLLHRAIEIAKEHGGKCPHEAVRIQRPGDESSAATGGAAGSWRTAFLRAPYGRDALVRAGFVTETFETAVTWQSFWQMHEAIMAAVQATIDEVCGDGWIACRFTHVYPDGPAPYYTVVATGHVDPMSRLSQWKEIKEAASEAILSFGGTISHHHAVGRDHRRWYEIQSPLLYREALRAAKAALDPSGILNPGALIDPLPSSA
ncbi:MAG: FAD-binding oxidoreductase [Acidimicrobiia bacterium]